MPRIARAVFPGHPHHVTQRGNGRARTFFMRSDYALYRDLLAEHAPRADVEVWAWVLMPNHVHMILVPHDADGLRRMLAPIHRYYAGHVHKRLERSGHFWQGRFGCVAMDEGHLRAALRYVVLNPVRAGLCNEAEAWPWSSIHAWLGRKDGITQSEPVLARNPDVRAMLRSDQDDAEFEQLRQAESVGRPLGSDSFLSALESSSGRRLKPSPPGRPRKNP